MHPFTASPICPRCSKAVYAAEQVMGPGRKLYHKPCLACMTCNKRLDSYTLLEHDQEPYCKPCHVRNFGTRDLRAANLPNRQNSVPPSTPPRSSTPARSTTIDLDDESRDSFEDEDSVPMGRSQSLAGFGDSPRKLMQTSTGTRYGSALGSGGVTTNLTGSPRKWGGMSNPSCGRCSKTVYFAEQVKAVGKTWHKGCLRCTECGTSLDSTRLRDHEGDPYCARCHNKLHGPQGGGYALLGKAGGS